MYENFGMSSETWTSIRRLAALNPLASGQVIPSTSFLLVHPDRNSTHSIDASTSFLQTNARRSNSSPQHGDTISRAIDQGFFISNVISSYV